MSQVNVHIGSEGPSTLISAQPTVSVVNLLDSIVTDLGPGVNGWSLYDDMRVTGSSYPFWPVSYTAYGVLNDVNYFFVNYGPAFTSGSQQITCNNSNGFGGTYGWSWSSTSTTPISLDQTNVYNVYVASGFSGTSEVSQLNQNFAQATTHSPIYQKLTYYVVLQCSSSIKTYYVLLGQMRERAGAPVLYTQVFETWNTGTHAGTNGSAMEHTRLYWEGGTTLSAQARYISWFYPEVLALWTEGVYGYQTTISGAATPASNFMYIGNLDTSGTNGGNVDQNALVFINGDTSHSGYFKYPIPGTIITTPTSGSAATGPFITIGAFQCLRTRGGSLWSMPATGGMNVNYYNSYQVKARGRSTPWNLQWSSTDVQGKAYMVDIDVWHMGSIYISGSYEGRRGRLRYLKAPQNNTQGMSLGVYGPCNDGNSYVVCRSGISLKMGLYSSVISAMANDGTVYNNGSTIADGWAQSARIPIPYTQTATYTVIGEVGGWAVSQVGGTRLPYLCMQVT